MAGRVLLTGASGALGRGLAKRLKGPLLLTDIAEFPDPLPADGSFRRIDLADKAAVLALAPEVSGIVHLGAVSVERPFEEILLPNYAGTFHIFELARLTRSRVIFASSNHAVGFQERGRMLDEDCDFRPDGFYGLSKAMGELTGRLYWDKHGVESLSIRIGSALPAPAERRHLSTWLGPDDLLGLIEAGLAAPSLGCRVAWGASANAASWWRHHGEATLGYAVRDRAEDHAVPPAPPADPVTERYQGGAFTAIGYSREAPSPADIFDWMRG